MSVVTKRRGPDLPPACCPPCRTAIHWPSVTSLHPFSDRSLPPHSPPSGSPVPNGTEPSVTVGHQPRTADLLRPLGPWSPLWPKVNGRDENSALPCDPGKTCFYLLPFLPSPRQQVFQQVGPITNFTYTFSSPPAHTRLWILSVANKPYFEDISSSPWTFSNIYFVQYATLILIIER